MKNKYSLLFLGMVSLLFGCQNNISDSVTTTSSTTSFVILDANNKQTISTLEYSEDGSKLISSNIYDEDEELEKSIEYEYSDAEIASKIITTPGEDTRIISYSCSKSMNDRKKLSNITRALSDGTDLTIEYSYDDSGRITAITATNTEDGVTTIEGKIYE